MKSIKSSLVILSATLLPALAGAQMEGIAPGGYGSVGSMPELIHKIENLMGLIFGAVAVIAFVVAGILLLTAGGQPEKVQTARQAFIWGVVGVIVGIIAFSIVAIVGSVIS